MSANPELVAKQREERLKQYAIMNCGVGCRIIEYNGSQDLVVKFDNGDIVKASYQNFRLGCIKSPTACREKENNLHIGEVKQFQNGGHGRIICRTDNRRRIGGHASRTYIVRYEEDGYETEVTYPQFQSGRVFHPIFNKTLASTSNSKTSEYVGKIYDLKCGVSVEIVNYYPNKDEARCDIRVVNQDEILKGISIRSLKDGGYTPPILHVGEINKMACGQKAKIIKASGRTNRSIDVEFEDGTIVKNRTYYEFTSGCIPHPNITSGDIRNKRDGRVDSVHRMVNGIDLRIIKYNKGDDIDIEFEDGTIIKNTSYTQITRKTLAHPTIKYGKGTYLSFELDGVLKRDDDNTTYYKCRCLKCNLEEALTPQEMLVHRCN